MKFKRSAMLGLLAALLVADLLFTGNLPGQAAGQAGTVEKISMPPNRMAHVLVVAQTKGFQHDSI